MAREFGRNDDAAEFFRRSQKYRNLFDKGSGFLRPRRRDGSWYTPFSPLATEGSGNWQGSGGPGYVEGHAWTYSWFVPHDIGGLADLFGRRDSCVIKLDSCFRVGHFTITNEPDIAYPYLFTYFPGWESRTVDLVRSIREQHFRNTPDGLPGNDDAGTMSAWYVFSALGVYPACPGSGEYRLGIPLFDEIIVTLPQSGGEARTLRIRKTPATGTQGCEVRWNGHTLRPRAILHSDLVGGGTLAFEETSR
jgi:predicted alpha-1,2-mannosidase